MGAYSKPTLLADVFINHFATKNTVLFVILPEQPYVKEIKKKGMPHQVTSPYENQILI